MGRCQLCKKQVDMPFTCSYCGQQFCSEHRLPEYHRFPNLPKPGWKSKSARETISIGLINTRENSMTNFPQKNSENKSVNPKIIILLIIIGISGFLYLEYNSSLEDINTFVGDKSKEIETGFQEFTEVVNESYQEVKQPKPSLSDFESLDELILFLEQDNISDIVYTSDFKCSDFAEALVNRAKIGGYNIEVYSMWDSELEAFIKYVETLEYTTTEDRTTITTTFSYGEGSGHALCTTTINSKRFIIEPQSDMIYALLDSGYQVRYFGEVTQ